MPASAPAKPDDVDLVAAGRDTLYLFSSRTPTKVKRVKPDDIDGDIVGIDRRPENDRIYLLTDESKLYIVDPDDGDTNFVAQLSVSLRGDDFGMDFNPQADRLRVVSDSGQNLRINPANGATTADGNLDFANGDENRGESVNVSAAAYTNNRAGASSTRLFDIETDRDDLVRQNPPNDGTLVTVDDLSRRVKVDVGFDIVSKGDDEDAYVLDEGRLFRLDLDNGKMGTGRKVALPASAGSLTSED